MNEALQRLTSIFGHDLREPITRVLRDQKDTCTIGGAFDVPRAVDICSTILLSEDGVFENRQEEVNDDEVAVIEDHTSPLTRVLEVFPGN